MTAAEADENWDSAYTEGCRLRFHLSGMARAFSDGTRLGLDRERCRADEYPERFARLVSAWNNCFAASQTVNARYQEDWDEHGNGVLAEIAAEMRATALWKLKEAWEGLSAKYVSETLEIDRKPWDCPYCGVAVPTEHVWDDGRCPSCMVILEVRQDGKGWC